MSPDIQRDARGNDPWVDRLSEYVDGGLTAAERGALEVHLAGCAACTQALDELRAVVSRAHALDDVPPAEDLWPGIAAGIAREAAAAPGRSARAPLGTADRMWWARRFEIGVPQLAAAGMLLIALSAGAVWLALRGPASAPVATSVRGAAPRPQAIAAKPTAPAGSTAIPASDAGAPAVGVPAIGAAATVPAIATNPGYDATIAALEQALDDGRGKLDPKTLRVIERNLRIIDHALAEARQAVAADPNNAWLQSHLAATMKRKVDLLRTATLLTAAQG
jgi:anti-sigma factor RsiW